MGARTRSNPGMQLPRLQRRQFLQTVSGLAAGAFGAVLARADDLPRNTNPRAISGDSVEPAWDQRLTITVGSKQADLVGTTDSETIFALLLDQVRTTKALPGDAEALAGATAETVRRVSDICAKLGVPASLNVGVTDGRAMAFARYSTEGPGNSLYLLEDGHAFPGALVVASERLDGDSGWRAVPDRNLLSADRTGVSVSPL